MTMTATAQAEAPAGRFPRAENRCRVVSNDPVNAEYRLLLVEAPATGLTAYAGQFFHLLCPTTHTDQPFLRRPMSIYRIDRENRRLGFLYKVTGKGTRALMTLGPGDELNATGPLGVGFDLPAGTQHVAMVARGVGLATLAPLARFAAERGARVTAILSARAPDLLMSRDELEAAGAGVIEVNDLDGTSKPEDVADRLREIHAEVPIDFMATCGSNRLLGLTRGLCAEWGIPGQVAVEAFMGCGLGMCFACVVPVRDAEGKEEMKRVCYDGPVFSVNEVTTW
ncbi:dihydroorotate dehydrogenase electron transfer subunit [Pseudooceanicola batsensis HTCC2597]|uniref:Dihydroorotate dehydrogenase electron transfer subunit n=1 Tax=Pseudooceanicola batsensis (strain ATCC BAA-863 / DSM 15984 / KCTC 12145 / HTCC2597) TaxID=252305 RepID=A3U0T2_PSEBH|nr:dihydroorotate dehydrogenase electron transfer subunit [Pseudooceanicola batsensis]EAQ02373.1 dihydroorotate dehydrogenase electron transfer subunit [Pseudooceanicola batsensis HTCC2597]